MNAHRTLPALLLAALLGAALTRPARAAFEDLGAGARVPGMGNVFVAVADDVNSIHYNPAGLAQLERPQLSASYSRMYLGLSDGSQLGSSQLMYASPLKNGRWGGFGGAWERFSLDSLYSEQSLFLSYGRRLLLRDSGAQLLAGISAKYLNRSFQKTGEASNAMNNAVATGLSDPVLSGSNSKSVPDADFGLLYRFPRRVQIGLLAQHFLKPDVGFAGGDKLPMNVRLGVGFRSLWMNLGGELRMEPSPTGSTDRDLILAAERYFPTLDMGQFGFRGSLGMGSRDWKQLTFGLSYRINKIQTDYAFVMPIGTVKGTAGTHRVGLTFHFGAPTAEQELTQDLLTQAERMREGKSAGYGYEWADPLRPKDLLDPTLSKVKLLVEARQYRSAYRTLVDVAKDLPPDDGILRLSNRLSLISYFYPELSVPEERWEVQLSSGLRSFLYAEDRAAILLVSHAFNMRPTDTQLEKFLAQLEEGVGIKAVRLPPEHPRTFLEDLLFRVEVAHNRNENTKVLALLEDVLTVEPENVTALERVGTNYFIMGRYANALSIWERALPLEKDPKEVLSLQTYIAQAREKALLPAAATPLPGAAAQPAAAASAEEPLSPLPPRLPASGRPRLQPAPQRAPNTDPMDIEKLYQKGVEHYARGERLQATAMFLRILQLDPQNAQAKKALQRLGTRPAEASAP